MSVLGFDKACDLLLGADIVKKPKPDPEAAKTIMERLAVDRSHTVVIGDALTDVQMGLNAGVRASVGVLTGFATLEQFSAITPYVGNSVADIEVMTPGGKRQ
jgi:phosphoglycolate phosphatase-like HAD superfamily hydrolase